MILFLSNFLAGRVHKRTLPSFFYALQRTLFAIAFALLSPAVRGDAAIPQPNDDTPVLVSLVSEVRSIEPGQRFWVALRQVMAPQWHTYYKIPGDSGMPTEISWELPSGFTAGDIHWVYPKRYDQDILVDYIYENEVLLMVPITPPANLPAGSEITLTAETLWLQCKKVCMPGNASVSLTLPVRSTPTELDTDWHEAFNRTRANWDAEARARSPESAALGNGYPQSPETLAQTAASTPTPPPASVLATPKPVHSLAAILGFALLGGLILNLMPCVFPVIGIKIMGFVNQAGQDRKHIILHGLVFSAGVVASFWLLAVVFLALREAGESVGWGFQMQNPHVVVALCFVFLLLALNMIGAFEIGTSVMGAGSSLAAKQGMSGTFFSGVLASVAATPCAAPFLGTALGATLDLPPILAFLVFTAIAVGLALPYLLLSAFPAAIRLLPRPGAWMESLKQGLAFLLFGTVAFLVWILAGQLPEGRLLDVLFALICVATAAWIYGRWSQRRSGRARILGTLAAVAFMIAALTLAYRPYHEFWQPWSPERVAELRAEDKPVYVDFTARWCATCQLNKERVFTSEKVIQTFREKGIVALKADWTNHDDRITQALKALGKSAVPVNLIYYPGETEPYLLPELLDAETVLEALERIPEV